jgi:hypothetical protein
MDRLIVLSSRAWKVSGAAGGVAYLFGGELVLVTRKVEVALGVVDGLALGADALERRAARLFSLGGQAQRVARRRDVLLLQEADLLLRAGDVFLLLLFGGQLPLVVRFVVSAAVVFAPSALPVAGLGRRHSGWWLVRRSCSGKELVPGGRVWPDPLA